MLFSINDRQNFEVLLNTIYYQMNKIINQFKTFNIIISMEIFCSKVETVQNHRFQGFTNQKIVQQRKLNKFGQLGLLLVVVFGHRTILQDRHSPHLSKQRSNKLIPNLMKILPIHRQRGKQCRRIGMMKWQWHRNLAGQLCEDRDSCWQG